MPEVYLEYFIALLYVYSTVQYLLAIFSYFRVQYTVMYIILGGHSFIFIIFFIRFLPFVFVLVQSTKFMAIL